MNYVILGANSAGLSAAVRILKLDPQAKITVIEKSNVISFGACGIPYYIGGEFEEIERMTARSLNEFIQLGIAINTFHSAIAIRPDSKQVEVLDTVQNRTEWVHYDKLLIAVGASPTIPAIDGITLSNVHTMHSKMDAETLLNLLPEVNNIVIIGAGFIGVEAAETFVTRGKNVTLIEFSDRVLARTFDAEITQHIQSELVRRGVAVQLSEKVLNMTSTGARVRAVVTDKGDYPADLVIVATGFKPNTQFLKTSGIHLSKEGAILIDEQCQTNLTDIYAAGDCATVPHKITGNEYIPLATTANKLGRIAGDVMGGKPSRFIGTLGSSGIRVFEIEAGRTGIAEEQAKQRQIDYATVFIQDKNHTDYVPNQSAIWIKLIYQKVSRQLLGGQICGSYHGGAVHRVDALAVAIYSGLTVDELGMMDFVYAPPFARTWDALNIAGNVAK